MAENQIVTEMKNEIVPRGKVIIRWFGVMFFAIHVPGAGYIFTDPYLCDTMKDYCGWARTFPPPFEVEEYRPDTVFISHDHLDHLDPGTLVRMKGFENTCFLGAEDSCVHMRKLGIKDSNIIKVCPGERHMVKGAEFIIVESRHLPPKGPKPQAIGAIIKSSARSIYFAGDTTYESCVVDKIRESGEKIDIALLPINGKGGNMPATDAAHMAWSLGAQVVVPGHYGLIYESGGDPYEVAFTLMKLGLPVKADIIPFGGMEIY